MTHFDFHQTYTDKIEKQVIHNFQRVDNESEQFLEKARVLMANINQMALLLIKMSMQNIQFINYSYSILVLSAIYASTAFLKHS